MMHLFFSELNLKGYNAIKTAKLMGCEVTYFYSEKYRQLFVKDTFDQICLHADRVIAVENSFSFDCLFEAVSKVHEKYPIDAGIALLDYNIAAISKTCDRLGIRFTSDHAISICRDKSKVRKLLSENGIRNTRWSLIRSESDLIEAAKNVRFPSILKPASSAGKLGCFLVKTFDELRERYLELLRTEQLVGIEKSQLISSEMLLEEFVEGELFSVEVASSLGEVKALCVGQRHCFSEDQRVELGTTVPPRISSEKTREIEDYAIQIVSLIGLDVGIFHVEIMLGKSGPVLIEVNPRMMGGNGPVTISHSIQKNVYELLIQLFCGKPIPSFIHSSNAITSRVLASATDEVLHTLPSLAPLVNFKDSILGFHVNASLGQRLQRASSNFGIIGSFEVIGSTPQESFDKANQIQSIIEKDIQIPLAY
jgi:biotin carboxylase